ncbi:MAG: hypothetical protein RL344_532 [Pseudomonadota bacterium]|jgi:glycosyltransferase involved in cell wall biosynthesis
MKVSYLIPSFNHSKYIEYTLNSILSDSKSFNYEIILIDDGSTDQTKKIVIDWVKKNSAANIFYTFRENKGLCVTLNELVKKSSGNIIRLCASDDAIHLGSTERIITHFEKTSSLVLIGDAILFDSNNNEIQKSAIKFNGGNIHKMKLSQASLKQEIISNWSIPGPCFALKKEVYDIVGYYSEDLLIEDWDFFLRVVALTSIEYIDCPIAYYRTHDSNTCKTQNLNKRLLNLKSQKLAGLRNITLLKGTLKYLLIKEVIILILKISLLNLKKLFKYKK